MNDDTLTLTLRTLDKSRHAQVTLPTDYTVEELIEASRHNWSLPRDTDYTIRSERMGRQLGPRDALGPAGVMAGDVLEIVPLLEAGSGQTAQTRRLQADFAKIVDLVGRAPHALRMKSKEGDPPTKYVFVYRCRSVERLDTDPATLREEHQVEIKIPSGYPLEPPVVRLLTPIHHPHVFTNGNVCLGSRWQVGEGLDNLLKRIGAILRFEPAYLDFKSPANLQAAHWAAAHLGEFPLEPDPFGPAAQASPSKDVRWVESPPETT